MTPIQLQWLDYISEENHQHTNPEKKKFLGNRGNGYKLNILGSILYILDQNGLGFGKWSGSYLNDCMRDIHDNRSTSNAPPSETRLYHSYPDFKLRTSTGIALNNERFEFKGHMYKSLLGMDLGITHNPKQDGKQTNSWREIADYVRAHPNLFFSQYDD